MTFNEDDRSAELDATVKVNGISGRAGVGLSAFIELINHDGYFPRGGKIYRAMMTLSPDPSVVAKYLPARLSSVPAQQPR